LLRLTKIQVLPLIFIFIFIFIFPPPSLPVDSPYQDAADGGASVGVDPFGRK